MNAPLFSITVTAPPPPRHRHPFQKSFIHCVVTAFRLVYSESPRSECLYEPSQNDWLPFERWEERASHGPNRLKDVGCRRYRQRAAPIYDSRPREGGGRWRWGWGQQVLGYGGPEVKTLLCSPQYVGLLPRTSQMVGLLP